MQEDGAASLRGSGPFLVFPDIGSGPRVRSGALTGQPTREPLVLRAVPKAAERHILTDGRSVRSRRSVPRAVLSRRSPMTRVVKAPRRPPTRTARDAPSRLFADEGYEDTSVQGIVEAVGVAKGTFYHYFAVEGGPARPGRRMAGGRDRPRAARPRRRELAGRARTSSRGCEAFCAASRAGTPPTRRRCCGLASGSSICPGNLALRTALTERGRGARSTRSSRSVLARGCRASGSWTCTDPDATADVVVAVWRGNVGPHRRAAAGVRRAGPSASARSSPIFGPSSMPSSGSSACPRGRLRLYEPGKVRRALCEALAERVRGRVSAHRPFAAGRRRWEARR